MVLWTIVGILYFPVFVIAWLLRTVFRIALAFTYLLLLDAKMFKSIMTNL